MRDKSFTERLHNSQAADDPLVVIIISGGLVRQVTGLPNGFNCEVHDYDVDGADIDRFPDDYRRDVEGQVYAMRVPG
jgi:hypothetical protein